MPSRDLKVAAMAGVAVTASRSFTKSCAGSGLPGRKSDFRVTPAGEPSNCNAGTKKLFSRPAISSKTSDRNKSCHRSARLAMDRSCAATTSDLVRERDTTIDSSFMLSKWNVSSGFVADDPIMKNLGSLSCHGHDGLVELISSQNSEPEWMLRFRQDAYKQWVAMERPEWAADEFHSAIDVDQELLFHTVASLSSSKQQENVVIDGANNINSTNILDKKIAAAGLGSVSFATEHREALKEAGVIFCSFTDAIRDHPELVKKYLGKVIDVADNYYAALNSAVFRGGSFCYVPKNTICPMDISTYFLPDAKKDVQVNNNFERILIVCDENASVSYLGCTSPSAGGSRSSGLQLQVPVVELFCARGAEIKFSTIQNWDPTVQNFVSKGGLCDGPDSKISWVQIDTGSAVTRQRPRVVLRGDRSSAEFFTATLTDAQQRADVGAHVVHVGKNTSSRVVARTIAASSSHNSYHHVCQVQASASCATSTLDCDSMLIGDHAFSEVMQCISVQNSSAQIQQDIRETSNVLGKEQLFYCEQRGIPSKEAVVAMVQAFYVHVINILPYEFASEVSHMMGLKMEDALRTM